MIDIDALLERVAIVNGDKGKEWSQAEDDFLRENLGRLTDSEIGEQLGRTEVAVHLRWKRDLRLPAPSKDPMYITANRIAMLLGADGHTVCHWIDAGMLPGEIVAGGRYIRRVLKNDLLNWLCHPDNWVYFRFERVRDPNLRMLLENARAGWGDEWWTTRQVADYWEVDVGDVKRHIKMGRLQARHVPNRHGRYPNPRWANWFVLKSEAERVDLSIYKRGSHANR